MVDFYWKVLQDMIETIGKHAPGVEIFEDNPHHMPNYGVVAKFLMDKSTVYSTFCQLHAKVFKVAKEMSEHKTSFEESFNQAIFNIVKSFMKASQPLKPTAPPSKPNVIKVQLKQKVVRKADQFDLKMVSKKMICDVIEFSVKTFKNKTLISAGLGDHIEKLLELDILK
jgi:hypothetical protein